MSKIEKKEEEKYMVKKILYDHLDILFDKLDSQNEKIDNLKSNLKGGSNQENKGEKKEIYSRAEFISSE